jgi:uncharacterized membrane protein (DUF485 family)
MNGDDAVQLCSPNNMSPQMKTPMTAASAPCGFTREELDNHLRGCEYGANEAMYGCYFIRETTFGAPLCIVCRQPISAHAAAPEPIIGAPVDGPPPVSTPFPFTFPTGGAFGAHPLFGIGIATLGVPRLPKHLKVGEDYDKLHLPAMAVLWAVGVLLMVVAAIILIAFIASGLVKRVPWVVITPSILIAVGLLLICLTHSTTVVIEKHRGNRGKIQVTRRMLLCCCCPLRTESTVGDLGDVTIRGTGVRINRVPVMEVVAVSRTSDVEVPLFRGYNEEALQEMINWQAYFRAVGNGTSLPAAA